MEPILERRNDLVNNHVSPHICQRLADMGLKIPSNFFWKAYNTRCILGSYAFDVDDYYKGGDALIWAVDAPLFTVPAWTAAELESYIPDYFVERLGKEYQLHLDAQYPVDPVYSNRFPDLFGLVIQEMICKSIFNLNPNAL